MFKSLCNSYRGLKAIVSGKAFLIELIVGVLMITSTWVFSVFTLSERLIVITFAVLVLCLEGLNTALERLLDIVHPQYNDKVKVVKDILGGTVLISIIGAFVVGVIISARIIGCF